MKYTRVGGSRGKLDQDNPAEIYTSDTGPRANGDRERARERGNKVRLRLRSLGGGRAARAKLRTEDVRGWWIQRTGGARRDAMRCDTGNISRRISPDWRCRRRSLISFARRIELCISAADETELAARGNSARGNDNRASVFLPAKYYSDLPACLPAFVSVCLLAGASIPGKRYKFRSEYCLRIRFTARRATFVSIAATRAHRLPRGVNVIFVTTIKSCLLNFYGSRHFRGRPPSSGALIPRSRYAHAERA